MKNQVERDERTVVVEKASHSAAYIFIIYAILIDVAYRAFKLGESSFDLLAIVILGGIISTIYQARYKVLNNFWLKMVILAMVIAIFIAILIAIMITTSA